MVYLFTFKSTEFKVYKRVKCLHSLLISLKKKAGRSNLGRIICLGRGGGFKRFYRLIDFKRIITFIPAYVLRFEYDPNRNIFIVLICYLNGFMSYILASLVMKIGFFLYDYNLISYKNGTAFLLSQCLVGSFLNCIKNNTLIAKYARAAGTFVKLVRKFGSYVLLRLCSGEELFVFSSNGLVLGRLSMLYCKLIKRTSAGVNRRRGYRPKVRGVAKNPVDHPHGGGAGRTTAGQPSVSAWGIYTKGVRTSTRFNRFSLTRFGFFRRRDNIIW
jgi:large subunit ribosomal protein L2